MSKLALAYAMKKRGHRKPAPVALEKEAMHEEGAESAADELDMIDRLIARRKRMSEGGMVANDVGVAEADKLPAEFDDLVLRDDLEFSYDAKNSGDELGRDEDDLVARAMRRRKGARA